jgi:Flp pilus assembly protein TadG
MSIALLRALARRAAALARSSAGNAAVEFGVVAPILVTLLAGTADLGTMATQKSTLDAAVRAGGQYARFDPTDTASIISRVNSYTAFSPALTSVAVTGPTCECDDGTGVSDCSTGTCATGPIHSYVTITATQAYSTIIPLSVLSSSTLTATVTIRAQ